MFRFNDKKEEHIQRRRQLEQDLGRIERPDFKELVIILYKQYLIIIPGIIVFFLVLMFIIKGLLKLWGA